MIITNQIKMDLTQQRPVEPIHAVQDDRYCRNLELSLTVGGEIWEIPVDAAVLIRYSKSDGTGGEYDTLPDGTAAWTAEGNVLTVALAPQVLTVPGPTSISIVLVRNEVQISTFPLLINVHAAVNRQIAESEYYGNVTGLLTAPAAGEVGQVFRIAAMDERGHVTAVEAVTLKDDAFAGFEPAEEDIPKVFLTGTAPTTKDEGELPLLLEYRSKTEAFQDYATLKVQGDSSAGYPKKNFNLKLFKDADRTEKDKRIFRNWSKTHKYCLKANWIDITHARNVVGGRLWGQVARSREDFDSYPAGYRESANCGAVDGFPVKVYLNGVYQGRYTWNIRKDESMFNMDSDTGVHAALIADAINGITLWRALPQIDSSDWTDELNDTVPEAVKTGFQAAADFVMNSTDEEFKANIGEYFYLSSLIDYYIYIYCILMIGGLAKSQTMLTYDAQKWMANIYDMDTTWALHWNGGSFYDPRTACPSGYTAQTEGGASNLLYERLAALFPEEIKARYAVLRETVLSDANIINEFERFMDIMPPQLTEEDYAQTTAGGAFTEIPSCTTNTLQKLRSIIAVRMAYCDEKIPAIGTESDDGNADTETAAMEWVQGGIDGTGAINESTSRIRTVDTVPAAITQVSAETDYVLGLACYDENDNFVGFFKSSLYYPSTSTITLSNSFQNSWNLTAVHRLDYSVRLVMAASDGSTKIEASAAERVTFRTAAPNLWESGTIGGNGVQSAMTTRIRMTGFVDDTITTVTAATGYNVLVVAYDGAGNCGHWQSSAGGLGSSEYVQQADLSEVRNAGYKYIRLVMKRTDNANINVEEGENITFA